MKKYWLAACLGFFLTGCSFWGAPGEMLRAPLAEAGDPQAAKAVEAFLPEGAVLTVPSKPAGQAAIQMADLDGDGQEELFALFKNERQAPEAGVIVLGKQGGKWVQRGSVQEVAGGIDYLEAVELDGKPGKELIVGFRGGALLQKKVGVFALGAEGMKELGKQSYTEIAVGDLNGDGQAEIVLLHHDRDKLLAKTELWQAKEGSLRLSSTQNFYDGINGFTEVQIGKVAADRVGVVVQVGIGAHSAFTSLLVWDGSKLVDVFAREGEGGTPDITFSPYSTQSDDFDHDGILEIGKLVMPKGSEGDSMAGTPWLQEWGRWDGGHGLIPVYRNYYDYDAEFRFDPPKEWGMDYSVRKEYLATSRSITFERAGIEVKIWVRPIGEAARANELFLGENEQWRMTAELNGGMSEAEIRACYHQLNR